MKKELVLVAVTIVLLIAAAIAACRQTAAPESSPTGSGDLFGPGAPSQVTEEIPVRSATPIGSPTVAVGESGVTVAAGGGDGLSPGVPNPAGPPDLYQVRPMATPILSQGEWEKVAFKYISEKYQVPVEQLKAGSIGKREFPLTNVVLLSATVVKPGLPTGGPRGLRSWVVGIDQNARIYEREGISALEAAERAARIAKYGKLEPHLYDFLQTKGPDDRVWVYVHVKGMREAMEIWAQVRARHPEAHIDPAGRPTKDTPMDLYEKVIFPEFLRETNIAAEAVTRNLTDYLRSRGFVATPSTHAPTIYSSLPKRVILELEKREDVSLISYPGQGRSEGLDSATPSIAAPTTWAQGRDQVGRRITGEGVTIGMLEQTTVDFANPYVNRGTTVGNPNVGGPHATNVAGAAASDHPKYRGTAYKSYILSAAKSTQLQYQQATSDLIARGASAINLSWGEIGDDFRTEDRFYDHISRYSAIPIVTIVHNDADDVVRSPGKGYNVITVGGYEDNDNVMWKGDVWWYDEVAGWGSNWKNARDKNNEKPELVAVSDKVITTTAWGWNDANGDWITDTAVNGTSIAAPMVTGGLALLFQQNGSLLLSPETVKAILMASAIHNIEGNPALVNDPPGSSTSDVRDGAGAVDLAEAYRIVASGWWEKRFIELNTERDFDAVGWYKYPKTIQGVKNTERVRAAIAWHSYVSGDYVDDILKTDLNLFLYELDGQGNEIEPPVQESKSESNSVESIDYYRSTAPPSVNYRIHIQRATPPSAEISNILGIAWWKGPRYTAATNVSQEQRYSDVAIFQRVSIDSVIEPRQPSSLGNEAIVLGGIKSYVAKANYPGLDPAYPPPNSTRHPIWVKGVEPGDAPFDSIDPPQIDDNAGLATFSYTAASGGQAPLVLARMGVTMDGSAKKAYDFYQYFDTIGTPNETVGSQTAYYRQFQRGDAKEDFRKNGVNDEADVDIVDANWIANYLAQYVPFDQVNAVNAASPRHDYIPPHDYDRITIQDAMFIGQMLSGIRDEFYDWVSGLAAGYSTKEGGQATVEAGALQLSPNGAGRIPLMLKNITGTAGVGSYDIKIAYDPSVIKVTSVDGGVAPFDKVAAFKIDGNKGVVWLNAFHAQVPGLTKDGAVAYLNVSPVAAAGKSTNVQVTVTTLSDVVGNDISSRVVNGSVTIK